MSASQPNRGGGGVQTHGVSRTSDHDINALLAGTEWARTSLTYAFPTSTRQYGSGYGPETLIGNFMGGITSQGKAAVLRAFSDLASFTKLTFTKTSDISSATIRVAESTAANPTAYAYYPGGSKGGDVWMGTLYNDYRTPSLGSYGWLTYFHELGHALGLKHGHERGGLGGRPLTTDHDSMEFSVMTYRGYVRAPTTGYTNENYGFAQSYMMYDIAALQQMYGADYTTNHGNSVYTFSATTGQMYINGARQGPAPGTGHGGASNRVFRTVWDGGGNDTYNFSNYTDDQSIDLRPGSWSTFSQDQLANLGLNHFARANLFNALLHHGNLASLIENAIGGSGDDTIVGNQVANILAGNAGDDQLTGNAGNDTLRGGRGTNTLNGGAGYDTASYVDAAAGVTVDLNVTVAQNTGGGGTDTLRSIEYLEGSNYNDTLTGNAGANVLIGGRGNDTLDGGGGSDTASYATARTGVVVNLGAAGPQNTRGGGVDQLISIENATGSAHNDKLVGDAGANILNGGAGNDRLLGGDGNDRLIGGLGRDILAGGAGADRFEFRLGDSTRSARDTIADFTHHVDKIDLSDVYGGRLHLVGGAFTHHAGEVHIVGSRGAFTVEADTNGDGIADFALTVRTVALDRHDLIL